MDYTRYVVQEQLKELHIIQKHEVTQMMREAAFLESCYETGIIGVMEATKDNLFKESSEEDRLDNRQKQVKPLVDAYFAWVKSTLQKPGLDRSSKLVGALNYSINQEPYLKVFLEDAKLPLDNNDAERSIKKFCVGKKNWQIIDSKNGAEASAMLYSLAETVKANNLKPYEYFVYLMYELMKYPRNNVPADALVDMMPWSDKIPEHCRKTKTR